MATHPVSPRNKAAGTQRRVSLRVSAPDHLQRARGKISEETDLPAYLDELRQTLRSVSEGNFEVTFPEGYDGLLGEIGSFLNRTIEKNRHLTAELERVS